MLIILETGQIVIMLTCAACAGQCLNKKRIFPTAIVMFNNIISGDTSGETTPVKMPNPAGNTTPVRAPGSAGIYPQVSRETFYDKPLSSFLYHCKDRLDTSDCFWSRILTMNLMDSHVEMG